VKRRRKHYENKYYEGEEYDDNILKGDNGDYRQGIHERIRWRK
jgi:hypothetical protein